MNDENITHSASRSSPRVRLPNCMPTRSILALPKLNEEVIGPPTWPGMMTGWSDLYRALRAAVAFLADGVDGFEVAGVGSPGGEPDDAAVDETS